MADQNALYRNNSQSFIFLCCFQPLRWLYKCFSVSAWIHKGVDSSLFLDATIIILRNVSKGPDQSAAFIPHNWMQGSIRILVSVTLRNQKIFYWVCHEGEATSGKFNVFPYTKWVCHGTQVQRFHKSQISSLLIQELIGHRPRKIKSAFFLVTMVCWLL